MTSRYVKQILIVSILMGVAACSSPDGVNKEATQPAAGAAVAPAAPTAGPFTKEVSYENISFKVSSPGLTGGNKFTIVPSGLTESNDPFTIDIEGRVVDVLTDDMDGDNSPEVAVITQTGQDKRNKAHLFTTFAGKSLGMVNFQDVINENLLAGYQGGDEYNFVENTFIRRFPLYENGQKTGKTRQFQFKMKRGEAMKQLVLDRNIDY